MDAPVSFPPLTPSAERVNLSLDSLDEMDIFDEETSGFAGTKYSSFSIEELAAILAGIQAAASAHLTGEAEVVETPTTTSNMSAAETWNISAPDANLAAGATSDVLSEITAALSVPMVSATEGVSIQTTAHVSAPISEAAIFGPGVMETSSVAVVAASIELIPTPGFSLVDQISGTPDTVAASAGLSAIVTDSTTVATSAPESAITLNQPSPSSELEDEILAIVVEEFNSFYARCIDLVVKSNKPFTLLKPILDNHLANIISAGGPDKARPYGLLVQRLGELASGLASLLNSDVIEEAKALAEDLRARRSQDQEIRLKAIAEQESMLTQMTGHIQELQAEHNELESTLASIEATILRTKASIAKAQALLVEKEAALESNKKVLESNSAKKTQADQELLVCSFRLEQLRAEEA